jgi:Uma2 family endonuclease
MTDREGLAVVTYIEEGRRVSVPGWVTDINAFRRWLDEEDLPEEACSWWLKGEVYIDVSKEQLFTHNVVKLEIGAVLRGLARRENLGVVFTDGVLLSNFAADVSCNPDGMFLSTATLQSDRVRLIEGRDNGHVEIQGSPDMVLEVLSRSSEEKDQVLLKRAYHEAGIREYWLVDVRKEVRFDVFRHTARGYAVTRKQEGWVRSGVFGRSFRLLTRPGPAGHPDYTLEVS